MTDSAQDHFCPSCAAKLPPEVLSSSTPECPICGTTIVRVDASVEGAAGTGLQTPQKRISTEELLLERLKQDNAEAPTRKLPVTFFAVLIAIIAVTSYSIYSATKKPEQFAKPKNDNGLTLEQRAMVTRAVDSLTAVLEQNPNNPEAHIALANAYYDGMDWSKAAPQYEAYLAAHPNDPSARVDFAYVLSQVHPEDLNLALTQIDSALVYKPDFLNALYNGGILAVQMTGSNHTEGLARAREYFARAKSVADTSAPVMAMQIDTLIAEIDRTGARLAKTPAK